MSAPGDAAPRPPYRIAVLVGCAVLALYLATIAPTTQFWDTSEYIASARILGIPHPPGSPLFVLLGHVWGMLPLASHYALRINIFSAVCSAAAAAFLFLVAERFLREIVADRGPRLLAAFAGILVGATSFTVWTQSVVNAKVYTLSLVGIALVLWLAVRWCDIEDPARRLKILLLIVYLVGLGATNHLMALLVVPAVVTLVLWADRSTATDWRVWVPSLAVAVAGLSVFAFLLVRAPLFPAINEGEPTTLTAFWDVLTRRQYLKPPVTDRQAAFASQLANYWQYFTWQFARDWPGQIRTRVAVVFAGVGLYGGAQLIRKDRRAGVTMLVTMATLTIALVFYLNFRYGYSIRPEETLDREVRERDYFFVASFQMWGVWIAIALGSAMEAIRGVLTRVIQAPRARQLSIGVLALCVVPLAGNRLTAPRSHETLARDFAFDLLNSLEPYAILITAGDNDVFPLWYAQEVEGVRRDVLIANLSLLNTTWHLRQLQRREVFPYVPFSEADIWRNGDWQAPTDPPFALTVGELDSLPLGQRLERAAAAVVGDLRVNIDAGILSRSDLATILLIDQNLALRPIYFAMTTGGYPDAKGLTDHLVAHGLARRLVSEAIVPADSMHFSPALGWIDVGVTERLAFGVYHPESAARERPRGWLDVPSAMVPGIYAIMYGELATILTRAGEVEGGDPASLELAATAASIAERVAANLR